MIIGITSDAHGNIFGLKKCVDLLERKGAEKIFFLGDAINYFSKSNEVIDYLKSKNIKCILGNHESILLQNKDILAKNAEVYNIEFTRKQLSEENYKFIKSWKDHFTMKVDGVRMLFVHGSPFDYLQEYIYADYDFEKFCNLQYDIIFIGHTHIPFIKKVSDKTIVNVGSVGFRRDSGKKISFSLFDTKTRNVAIYDEEFPLQKLTELSPFHKDIAKILKRNYKQGDTYV